MAADCEREVVPHLPMPALDVPLRRPRSSSSAAASPSGWRSREIRADALAEAVRNAT